VPWFSVVLACWEPEHGSPATPIRRLTGRSSSSFSCQKAYVIDLPRSLFQTVSRGHPPPRIFMRAGSPKPPPRESRYAVRWFGPGPRMFRGYDTVQQIIELLHRGRLKKLLDD
jgi:hypothetical protein